MNMNRPLSECGEMQLRDVETLPTKTETAMATILSSGDHETRSVSPESGNQLVAGLGSHWTEERASNPSTNSTCIGDALGFAALGFVAWFIFISLAAL